MKNLIRSISLVAVLLTAMSTIGAAHANSTATVQNNAPCALGVVTFYQSQGSQAYLYVPGQGVFNADVTSDITWVVINGQGVPQGQDGIVTLVSGQKIKVTVNGNIVVTDQSIVQ